MNTTNLKIMLVILQVQVVGLFIFLDRPEMVSFDTAKYQNARKAVASRVIYSDSAEKREESISIIARVDAHARKIIEEKAAGRLVVLTQALALTNQVPDITDEVLAELGLPTNVPTIDSSVRDGSEGVESNYSASSLYESVKESLFLRNQDAAESLEQDARNSEQENLDQWLP